MPERNIEKIRQRTDLEDLRNTLESKQYCWGTGIGYKIRDGKQTREPAIIAYVYAKPNLEDIPEEDRIPETIGGVTTDVYKMKEPQPDENPSPARDSEVFRPIAGGFQVDMADESAGTLTGGFIDDTDGENVIVVSKHVVTEEGICETTDNSQYIGQDAHVPDTDLSGSKIGEVKRVSDESENERDWAVISVDDDSDFSNEVAGLGEIGDPIEPNIRDRAVASNYQDGLVSGQILSVDVRYETGECTFDDMYHYDGTQIGGAGVSGSLVGIVQNGTFRPFAMHTARDEENSLGVNFQKVMEEADISIDDGSYSFTAEGQTNAHHETTVISDDRMDDTVTVVHSNISDDDNSETNTVENSDDGTTLDSQSHSLGPMGVEFWEADISDLEGYERNIEASTPDHFSSVKVERNFYDLLANPNVGLDNTEVFASADEAGLIFSGDTGTIQVIDDNWQVIEREEFDEISLNWISATSDGQYVAVTDESVIQIHDRHDEWNTVYSDSNANRDIAFSPNDDYLAVTASDDTTEIISMDTFSAVDSVASGDAHDLEWDPTTTEDRFATGHATNGEVYVWHDPNGDENWEQEESWTELPDSSYVSFNHDGSQFAYSTQRDFLDDIPGEFAVYDTSDWNEVHSETADTDDEGYRSVSFSREPDNDWLVLVYYDSDYQLYQVRDPDNDFNEVHEIGSTEGDKFETSSFTTHTEDYYVVYDNGAGYGNLIFTAGEVDEAEISGYVETDEGDELEGALITVINENTETVEATTTTNSNGNYSVMVPVGDRYHVKMEYEEDGDQYNAKSKPFINP